MAAPELADAGRVIAGSARGVRLRAPKSDARPLADRVKQTLFAILEPQLRGRAFLDLFAGSGAGGIEALSRGADRAVFVEREREAVAAIDANLRAAHFGEPQARVARADALGWLADAGARSGPFAVVLIDPPYDQPELLRSSLAAIEAAGPDGILATDGVAVAKHFWRDPPASGGLLASVRERRFGETALTFHRWLAEADARQTGEEAG
ncbi:MAG TPA: RsmD family RNA methyltransferase [Candidatus Eisenbacteria bacterium]|nr:RsmD family RNA methyltransferase [Candidatus Eisenbacteria bacterium]